MSILKVLQGAPDSPTVEGAHGRLYDQKALDVANAALAEGSGKGISREGAKRIADSFFDGSRVRLTPVESRTFIKIASDYKFESAEVRKAFIDSVLEGESKSPRLGDPKAMNLPFTRDLTKLNLDALLTAAQSITNTAPKSSIFGENPFAGVIDAAASKQIIEMLKKNGLTSTDKRTAAYLFKHCSFESTTAALAFKQAIFGFSDHKSYL